MHKNLLKECYQFEKLDAPGREWSDENYAGGYTSYGSLTNLHQLSPYFAQLQRQLDPLVFRFAKKLEMDFQGLAPRKALKLSSLWINIMPANVLHSAHIHPLSVISGTYYVRVPRGARGLRLEDPRLSSFMATPPRLRGASQRNQWFVEVPAKAGSVILFESWLRHEVLPNPSQEDRISISFNYDWI